MKLFILLVLGLNLVSCAQYGSLNGSAPTLSHENSQDAEVIVSTESVMETADTVVTAESNSIPGLPPSPAPAPAPAAANEKALADCVKQWPNLPEAAALARKAVVIELNKFASNDLVFEDTKQTDQPVMYLLNLNFDIPGQGQMQLRNKKGWYCLAIRTQTVKVFEIGVACETTLATATTERQVYDRFNITRDAVCN